MRPLFKPSPAPAKKPAISKPSSKKNPTIFRDAPSPNQTHFVSLIHSSKTTLHLRQIHAQILLHNLSSNSLITTQLISSSSLRNSIHYAHAIFNHYNPKNLFLFNAIIRGLAKHSCFYDVLSKFVLMLRTNVKPDRLTYPFVLNSLSGLPLMRFSYSLHGMIVRTGVEFDLFVRVSLVDMYVKVGKLKLASKVFDESPMLGEEKSTLLWNVLINGYCQAGALGKAMKLFRGVPDRNPASWTSLINGFLMNGDLDQALVFFDRMPEKNVVSWTTMVNGFSQKGANEKALLLFSRMLEEGARPNDFTVVSALSACAKIGALDTGLRIHDYIRNNGFRLNRVIGAALVDMYAKCGDIKSANEVFQETKEKDVITWSVMIWGWAVHGDFERAVQCFKQMMFAGIKPDEVVFLALLTACRDAGQVDLGLNFFESMELDYCIEPTIKHYALVVDLLGRAGRLNDSLNFIHDMPVTPNFVIWRALFCASRARKNIELSELAAQKLLELEPKHPGSYVFLSNVYASVGRWSDAERVRALMQNNDVATDSGWSYIEVDGQVHSFVAGDHAHKEAFLIHSKLAEIMAGARGQGYIPGTEWVLHNIEEEEKEDALGSHSEKLALAFALIRTPPGTTIRIVKNLRVCGDCHSLMKYASKISQRQIVLRNIKRFHHFKDGVCSCGDYW